MSVELEARLLAEHLPVNESLRSACPECGDSTFSVTRLRHSVVWNCFKASCPVKGYSTTSAASVEPPRRKKSLRPYTGAVERLSEEDLDYFRKRFDLELTPEGPIRASTDDRYIFPIYDSLERIRGYILRQPVWSGAPRSPRKGTRGSQAKALTYMHAQGPTQSWYPSAGTETTDLVLVEDQLSAISAQQGGVNAVALLGTHLNNDKVWEISQWQPSQVIIALDADATDQAFKLARKWGLAFPKTRVAILARDLKEEKTDDIRYILGLD